MTIQRTLRLTDSDIRTALSAYARMFGQNVDPKDWTLTDGGGSRTIAHVELPVETPQPLPMPR